MEALLYRWAGVENIATNSRGSNVNGRKLAFLEKFVGEDFVQVSWGANPGPQAGNIITGVWNDLFGELVGRLLVQGQMRNLFPNSTFNHNSDTLETSTSLDTILNGLATNAPTSTNEAILYWNFAVAALDAFEDRFNLSPEDFDARISQVLANAGFSGFLNTLRQADFLQAFANVIFGTSGNDTLNGGIGNDQINAAAGNDLISGGAGNDILDGALGNDTINGGDGNDTIKAGLGTDRVDGGNGQDTLDLDLSGQTANLNITNPLNGGSLPNISSATNFEFLKLTTGSGNDTITQATIINGNVFRSDDVFNGGAGNDVINPGLGVNDQVNGGSGVDTLILNYSINDVGNKMQFTVADSDANGFSGSAGRTATTGGWLDSISFTGIDRFNITGTRNADTIDISGTNSTVNAGDGNDTVTFRTIGFTADGGAGTDKLVLNLSFQTTGVNITFTPSGITTPGVTTTISNFESISLSNTGSGNDVVNLSATVGDGSSLNYGSNVSLGAGNDSIIGGSGRDAFFGEAGNDTLEGGADRDRLEGGDGNDILRGGAGDDNDSSLTANGRGGLFGGAGNDTLDGGDGNDYLVGGVGNDILTGGGGADKFAYDTSRIFTSADIGSDRITDFLIGTDKIVLDKTTFTAITSASGSALTSSEFAIINAVTNSEIVAGSSSAKIVFNQANGELFYNQNGTTTGLGTGSLFATLSGVSSLSATDFVVQA
ncbi:calcium-binding protein [Nostoc sp. CALU 1950]|uniref:calcium-binding protein n=1 Tax=Nostoc sp. CALU 1950 TaxID=3104321 RepID=UPI003EBAABE6